MSLAAYVGLTKPRIIELLLVTTVPAMFLAAGGVPPLRLVLLTMVGGCLAAASANAFNCVLDRDIDERMRRTRRRPLPRHIVDPRAATLFGLVLGVAATLWLGLFVNWLSAALALGANAFYIGVYTVWLKRRTPQNIVWGGIAGCFPPLIGWTAVTGSVSWVPLVLFLIVFLWTPPHTWALALRYREDYAAAAVPMLPVVRSAVVVGRQIMLYAVLTVAASLLLWPVAGTGWVYLTVALVAGAALLWECGTAVVARRAGADRRRAEADAAVPLVQLLPGAGLRGRGRRPAALLIRGSRDMTQSVELLLDEADGRRDPGPVGSPRRRRVCRPPGARSPARRTPRTSRCGPATPSTRRTMPRCRRCSTTWTSSWWSAACCSSARAAAATCWSARWSRRRALLDLQQQVVRALRTPAYAGFEDGRWSPHVTLARRVAVDQVGPSLEALAGSPPELVTRVRHARRWDSDRKLAWSLPLTLRPPRSSPFHRGHDHLCGRNEGGTRGREASC